MKIDKYLNPNIKRIFDIAGDNLKVLLITDDELIEKKENIKTIKPCKCGNFKVIGKTCFCKPEEILFWRRNIENLAKKYDLVFETDSIYNVFDYLKDLEIEEEAKKLLTEAVKQFKLNLSKVVRFLRIAERIREIEGKEKIKITHIAEAFQYRYKLD